MFVPHFKANDLKIHYLVRLKPTQTFNAITHVLFYLSLRLPVNRKTHLLPGGWSVVAELVSVCKEAKYVRGLGGLWGETLTSP